MSAADSRAGTGTGGFPARPAALSAGGFTGGAGGTFPGAGGGTGTGGGFPGFGAGTRRGGPREAHRGGGFLNASQSNAALNKLLQANASRYTWAAATVNSNNAAGYQLASGEPIMAIGGFNGTDPAPTLRQFETYVSEGKIHYFIASGGGSAAVASVAVASVAVASVVVARWRRRWLQQRRIGDHLVGGVPLHRRRRSAV